jgi:ABC-2 type transport system ATP-binding protein
MISVQTSAAKELAQKLTEIKAVKETKQMDGELKLIVKDGNATIPRIVEIAASSGIRIESISIRQPTLEDVFLHFTGREIRSEGGEEYHGLAAIKRRGVR